MTDPTPTQSPADTATTILSAFAEIGVGVASAMVPGAPVVALLVAYLPQLEELVQSGIALVSGVEVTDEELEAARLVVRTQRNRAQFEQWRIRNAAGSV